MQSGTSAGSSIHPPPCAVAITKDQSAMPTCPAGARSRPAARPRKAIATATTSNPAASPSSTPRRTDTPSSTAAAASATDAACPTAIGSKARRAGA
ncbi:MAG TPA: hypothetical protein VGI11_03890, partial [Variovorax sp.]